MEGQQGLLYFTCKNCTAQFATNQELLNHLERFVYLQCDTCGYTVKREDYFDKHINTCPGRAIPYNNPSDEARRKLQELCKDYAFRKQIIPADPMNLYNAVSDQILLDTGKVHLPSRLRRFLAKYMKQSHIEKTTNAPNIRALAEMIGNDLRVFTDSPQTLRDQAIEEWDGGLTFIGASEEGTCVFNLGHIYNHSCHYFYSLAKLPAANQPPLRAENTQRNPPTVYVPQLLTQSLPGRSTVGGRFLIQTQAKTSTATQAVTTTTALTGATTSTSSTSTVTHTETVTDPDLSFYEQFTQQEPAAPPPPLLLPLMLPTPEPPTKGKGKGRGKGKARAPKTFKVPTRGPYQVPTVAVGPGGVQAGIVNLGFDDPTSTGTAVIGEDCPTFYGMDDFLKWCDNCQHWEEPCTRLY